MEFVLPVEDRRTIWRELQAAGFELPELEVSSKVFWIAAAMVLTPLGLGALALRTWFALFSLLELTFLTYRLTLPLAVHPPEWCNTVRQAASCWRNIRRPDGQVVPWTREEISEKVRMLIAECACLPIEEVTEEARLIDLLGC